MAKQLDPRMIGTDLPLRVDNVISNTLSAYNSTLVNVTAENVLVNTLTSTNLVVTNNVTTNFLVSTINTDYTFSDSDNSKIFHFDTTTTPVISALFPGNISNGFNVALVNTGVGAIYLSAGIELNAPGLFNTIQNTGVLIYKHNNNFYGIGVFE